ncbi:hypothetical protein ACTFIZ_009805 [Dictyostelium cf. discoideum]
MLILKCNETNAKLKHANPQNFKRLLSIVVSCNCLQNKTLSEPGFINPILNGAIMQLINFIFLYVTNQRLSFDDESLNENNSQNSTLYYGLILKKWYKSATLDNKQNKKLSSSKDNL